MISKLKGKVSDFDHRSIIIDVSGVGFRVFVNQNLRQKVKPGEIMEIWTHLAAKENSLDLYGFEEREDLDFFEMLISVSGIGPRTALNILNIAPAKTIKEAVGAGDITHLTKVSGIGKKSAGKIVLELRDRLEEFADSSGLKEDVDVLEALQSLGYSAAESREALKKVPPEIQGASGKIKSALKILNNN